LSRISSSSDEVIGYNGTTSTDEEEIIDVSVGVVSCCVRGKLPYQYYRNGYGYFMKIICHR
jgi:hypothetical protein